MHPLSKKVQRAASQDVKRHWSPLHELMWVFDLKLNKMKRIELVMFGPKWEPSFTASIPPNKEHAIKEMIADPAKVQVFTDGS